MESHLTPKQLRTLRASTGNRVRIARTLVGLKQNEMAEALGVQQSRLSEIENRLGEPSLHTARRLSAFFGCAIEDLFPARESVAS